MSTSPFGDSPNPYQSPTSAGGYSQGGSPTHDQGNPLIAPAVCLIVAAVTHIVVLLLSLPFQLAQLNAVDPTTPEGIGRIVGMVGTYLVWMIMTVTIVIGSIQMLRLRAYPLATAACICAMIPVCSPCYVIGIPFGIWAFIILRREDVKARFS